jgi:hypothetical protein
MPCFHQKLDILFPKSIYYVGQLSASDVECLASTRSTDQSLSEQCAFKFSHVAAQTGKSDEVMADYVSTLCDSWPRADSCK